jgi:hypothetical protein
MRYIKQPSVQRHYSTATCISWCVPLDLRFRLLGYLSPSPTIESPLSSTQILQSKLISEKYGLFGCNSVSEKHIASIFRIEEYAKQPAEDDGNLSSDYSSTLSMEAICSSKTSYCH